MTANVSSGMVADGGTHNIHTQKNGKREERKGGGERNIEEETGGAELMETPLPFPQERKQYTLSYMKQHITRKDISHFPLEENRAARSGR